jgi:hypothetical protein
MRKQKKFKEFKKAISLIVYTKCPEKWILIDRETGESYQGNPGGHWDRLDAILKKNNFTE